MKTPAELWEDIGSLSDDELAHVLSKLYTLYDELLQKNEEDGEALNFFHRLGTAIEQSASCNLNRR